MPVMGRQSTIESPDPVSLVTPPNTTIANTSAQHTSSHLATALSCSFVGEFIACSYSVAEDQRASLSEVIQR